LSFAEGTFPTSLGIIKVKHFKQADGEIKSDISVPEGVTLLK
jgi:alpha-L-rhamnosidase